MMLNKKLIMLLVMPLFFSQKVFADGDSGITTVEELAVMISTTPARGHINLVDDVGAKPPCHDHSKWDYTINVGTREGSVAYSLLVSAHAQNKNVKVTGTGSCTINPDVEDVRQVFIDPTN